MCCESRQWFCSQVILVLSFQMCLVNLVVCDICASTVGPETIEFCDVLGCEDLQHQVQRVWSCQNCEIGGHEAFDLNSASESDIETDSDNLETEQLDLNGVDDQLDDIDFTADPSDNVFEINFQGDYQVNMDDSDEADSVSDSGDIYFECSGEGDSDLNVSSDTENGYGGQDDSYDEHWIFEAEE